MSEEGEDDKKPDTRPFGIEEVAPDDDVPTTDTGMRRGVSPQHIKRAVRRANQRTAPLTAADRLNMLRVGQVVKQAAIRLLHETISEDADLTPGLDIPETPELVVPRPGELLIRPKLGEFIIRPTEEELKEHGGISPLTNDPDALQEIADLAQETEHTRYARLHELRAIANDAVQREIVDHLTPAVEALCAHTQAAVTADNPRVTARHRHEMFNAVIDITLSARAIAGIMKTQRGTLPMGAQNDAALINQSISELIESKSTAHLKPLSSDQQVIYADLINRSLINAGKLTPLPQTLDDARSDILPDIEKMRTSVQHICRGVAQAASQTAVDLPAVREQLGDHLVDLQDSVLSAIVTLKAQGIKGRDAGDLVADGMSELIVAASNQATDSLTPIQRAAFVDTLNHVMDGIFAAQSNDRSSGGTGGMAH